ncbi:hypothetical protein HHI36_002195 [Cryptolaemus montrouzieri]|uniref:BESS domain-containing protein n=1 Tax=Cryptolaemus montrouzieri TaxID=559131 RepID=A0ABD2P9T3_9CUCU
MAKHEIWTLSNREGTDDNPENYVSPSSSKTRQIERSSTERILNEIADVISTPLLPPNIEPMPEADEIGGFLTMIGPKLRNMESKKQKELMFNIYKMLHSAEMEQF